jgi:hypothetical protein
VFRSHAPVMLMLYLFHVFYLQMDERGCLVNCFSREGQLAKLEVLGSKAFQHLQKILHPVTW